MYLFWLVICVFAITRSLFYLYRWWKPSGVPVSVNYHLTRQCNYSCGFCLSVEPYNFLKLIREADK